MTLARVDNAPSKKTGEISLDLAEMRPVNVVTLLLCHLKRPLRYGGYLCRGGSGAGSLGGAQQLTGGGGSSRNFPWSPEAVPIQWGGG